MPLYVKEDLIGFFSDVAFNSEKKDAAKELAPGIVALSHNKSQYSGYSNYYIKNTICLDYSISAHFVLHRHVKAFRQIHFQSD